MKLLIAASKSIDWAKELVDKMTDINEEIEAVIVCGHSDALEKFVTERPDVVLVDEYYEQDGLSSGEFAGKEVFGDITLAATDEEVILRCGFFDLPHDDYLKNPFMPKKLNELIDRRT